MKKIYFIAFCFCLLMSSCQQKKGQIVIEGKFKNANNEWVRLGLIGSEDLIMLDSVKMKNGTFIFEIPAKTEEEKQRTASPMMYQLILTNDNTLTTLAKAGDHIKIQADARNLLASYKVSGGEEAELMAQLDSALATFVRPTEKLYAIYEQNIENDSIRTDIEQQYVSLLQEHKDFLIHFIQSHPNNMASFIAFYQSYNRRSFFNEQADLGLLKKITNSLKKQYPDNPYVKNMQLRIEMLELVNKQSN